MIRQLPLGYIVCMNCHRPALWLVSTGPVTVSRESVNVFDFDLVTYSYDIDELDGESYKCDSCGLDILDENLKQDYIIFMELPEVEQ